MSETKRPGRTAGLCALTVTATIGLGTSVSGQGGENAATAVPISVPGSDTGTTVGYTDDADEVCPFASTAPDVWYTFTATQTQLINISLCQSGYDTKVYVYDDQLRPAMTVSGDPACDDDACLFSLKSLLPLVMVEAGEQYYVVVDGWTGPDGAKSGPYTLVIDVNPCPYVRWDQCPSDVDGGTPEGEPCGYGQTTPDDTLNGGCVCSTPGGCFQPIGLGETIGGRTYTDGVSSDADWFSVDIAGFASWKSFVVEIEAEFPGLLLQDDPSAECDGGPVSATRFEGCAGVHTLPVQRYGDVLWIGVHPDPDDLPGAPTQIDCDDPDRGDCPFAGADYALTVRLDPEACPDLDGSGGLDMADLLLLLTNWGPCPPVCPFDLDGSGDVDFVDLVTVLAAWGQCPSED